MWKKVSSTTLYIHKEEPVASYNPYRRLVGKPQCGEIEEIIVEEGHPWLVSIDNCLIHTKTNTLLRGCKNSRIPSFVKSIGAFAFCNCKGLKTIEIPESVTSIGPGAFSECEDLEEIELPDSVRKIKSWAFSQCKRLKSIRLSKNLKRIAEGAFSGCSSLERLAFGPKLEFIGRIAFLGCVSLGSVQLPHSVNKVFVDAFECCKEVEIYASAGSYAEQFAIENKILFKAI